MMHNDCWQDRVQAGWIRLLVLLLWSISVPVTAAGLDTALPDYSKAYDPERDPFTDGRNAIQLARQTNRRVLIQVGGAWCRYCRALDRFIEETPVVQKMLHTNFVLLKVNVSEENDNAAFLSGLPKTFGYPHIFVADNDGTLLYSKDTAQLLDNGRYSPAKFRRFLNDWRLHPPPRAM